MIALYKLAKVAARKIINSMRHALGTRAPPELDIPLDEREKEFFRRIADLDRKAQPDR